MADLKRSERLQIVLRMAAQKVEVAQKELGKAQQRLESEKAKVLQLQQFQLEYQNTLRAQAGQKISAAQYQSLNLFITRLGTAITEQQRQVAFVQVHVDRAREKWLQLYHKHKSMGDFIDRCRAEELVLDDKRLQRLMDEAAQQALQRKR
jgi:flagellar protein FliJ